MTVYGRLLPVVLNMSITGGIAIAAVVLVRLCLRRTPKAFSYALWGVVLLRLLCPVSFSSSLSFFRIWDVPVTSRGSMEYVQKGGEGAENKDVLQEAAGAGTENTTAKETVCGRIWLLGAVFLWCCGIGSLYLLRRKLRGAVRKEKNIYLCDYIGTAFVLGIFRPRIYLPTALTEAERKYVLLHEQIHIGRRDYLLRILAFFALSVHWFNPLVWLAFYLSERDMEMSCDELVMKKAGTDIRMAYSATLLNLASGKRVSAGMVLEFGEGRVKGRIKNIMRYQRRKGVMAPPMLVLVVFLFVVLGSNPIAALGNQERTGQVVSGERKEEQGQRFVKVQMVKALRTETEGIMQTAVYACYIPVPQDNFGQPAKSMFVEVEKGRPLLCYPVCIYLKEEQE